MRRPLLIWCLLLAGILCIAQQERVSAFWQSRDSNYNVAIASSGGTGWCGLVPAQGNLINCLPYDTAHSSLTTITDVVGTYNGAVNGTFSLNGSGPTGSPNLNNAGVFDGSTTHVDLPVGSKMLLSSAHWTVNIWINSGAIGGHRVAANDHTDGDSNGMQLYGASGSGITLDVGNGITTATPASGLQSTGTWYMLTYTFDGTTVTGYQNASSVGTSTTLIGTTVSNGSNAMSFGYNPAYAGDFWPGQIAGFAIWNTNLTGAQITTLNGL